MQDGDRYAAWRRAVLALGRASQRRFLYPDGKRRTPGIRDCQRLPVALRRRDGEDAAAFERRQLAYLRSWMECEHLRHAIAQHDSLGPQLNLGADGIWRLDWIGLMREVGWLPPRR